MEIRNVDEFTNVLYLSLINHCSCIRLLVILCTRDCPWIFLAMSFSWVWLPGLFPSLPIAWFGTLSLSLSHTHTYTYSQFGMSNPANMHVFRLCGGNPLWHRQSMQTPCRKDSWLSQGSNREPSRLEQTHHTSD